MDSAEIMKRLQEPFPPEDIEWRVGSTNGDKTKGIALAYVTNRAIMNRLDTIFGPFGWKNEFREWKGTSQLCGISIKVEGEWITKWDGADDSQTEAVKGGLSDAMKRAGYQWGIGRYLYNLENMWVPIEPAGKSYRLREEPRLPHWALPEGYEYKGKQPASTPPPQAAESNAPEEDKKQTSGQTGTTPPKSEGNGVPMSDAQRKYIYKIKSEKKINDDDFKRIVSELADGKTEVSNLNKMEASKVINFLASYQVAS
jgi:hypothetical protein